MVRRQSDFAARDAAAGASTSFLSDGGELGDQVIETYERMIREDATRRAALAAIRRR